MRACHTSQALTVSGMLSSRECTGLDVSGLVKPTDQRCNLHSRLTLEARVAQFELYSHLSECSPHDLKFLSETLPTADVTALPVLT